MSIVFLVILSLFLLLTRSFFSITFFAFFLLGLIFMIAHFLERNVFCSFFLIINEYYVWLGFVAFYLVGVSRNYLIPLYAAARDKAFLKSSYWNSMSYGSFYGVFITVLILFIIAWNVLYY